MKTLTVRVSDEEHKLMQAVAARRFMTITGITRAHFNALFVEDGLALDPAEAARRALEAHAKAALAPQKPVIERRPIPARNWNAEIVSRADKGETLADIAESYGQSLDFIKSRYKAGKENQQAIRDQYELAQAYNPTSPAEEEAMPQVQKPTHADDYNPNPFDDEPESTPQVQELVYDPVDPDNPTEEEQATNAEIARRRLVAMGFL
jgi:hypothetical protein